MKLQYLVFTLFFLLISCDAQKTMVEETPKTSIAKTNLTEVIDAYHQYQRKHRTPEGQWPDLSPEKVKDKIYMLSKYVEQLDEIDKINLSENDMINYEMLRILIEDKLYNLEYESYLMPLNAEGGFIIGMVYSTQNEQLRSEKDIDKYYKKLKAVPAYIDDNIDLLNKGLAKNKKLPKLIIENCVSMIDQYIETPIKELFISQPIKNSGEREDEGYGLVENNVVPAFKKLKKYLTEEYIPNTKEAIGVSTNEEGKEYYEQRVRFFTTLNMTPEEIFETGQKEVKRIRAEMEAIIKELKFDRSYADFLEFLRTDPQFYVDTPQELLNHASWLSKKAEEILPTYFGKLPRLPFTVNPVPASIAPNYTTGRYSGGSMGEQRAGQYWVNTYNLPSRPLFVLPSLTLHEAVPGHHLQISLAKELEGLPKFRNTYLSAFGEGWGLYSEYLGKEAGIYTSPYEDFGRLTYEMWRACRLVVDPGMHYMGWTREEAVEFMASNTALSLHEVNTEINRYIGWPGQAVSYKIGELKIRELRKRAEEKLGDNFDIREFHDLILSNGSIPLISLERIVDSYIAEKA